MYVCTYIPTYMYVTNGKLFSNFEIIFELLAENKKLHFV